MVLDQRGLKTDHHFGKRETTDPNSPFMDQIFKVAFDRFPTFTEDLNIFWERGGDFISFSGDNFVSLELFRLHHVVYQSNVLFIIDMGTGVGVGWFFVNERQLSIFSISSTVGCIRGDHYHDRGGKKWDKSEQRRRKKCRLWSGRGRSTRWVEPWCAA